MSGKTNKPASQVTKQIARLIDEGEILVKQLAFGAAVSMTTAYRLAGGEYDLYCGDAQRLIALLDSRSSKLSLAIALLDGTGFYPVASAISEEDMDINGDGKIDLVDALKSQNKMLNILHKQNEVVIDAMSAGRVNADDLLRIEADSAQMIEQQVATHLIIKQHAKEQSKRKKARQVDTGFGKSSAFEGQAAPLKLNSQPQAAGGNQ